MNFGTLTKLLMLKEKKRVNRQKQKYVLDNKISEILEKYQLIKVALII